jgi:Uma2 family endonuclease
MSKETITIKLPKGVRFSDEQFEEIKLRNQEVNLRKGRKGASFVLTEKDFLFNEVDFFEVKLPDSTSLEDDQFIDLMQKNDDIKIEMTSKNTIVINIGTTIIIGTFSTILILTLAYWDQLKNIGNVLGGTCAFFIKKSGKKLIPDVSFTLFSKMVNDYINAKMFPQVPPTLCIEIVSNKSRRELEKNLDKMKNHWMPDGTDIGLVIDPFEHKYYLFENHLPDGREIEFAIPFTHYLLPDLELNFNDLLDKAIAKFPGIKFP